MKCLFFLYIIPVIVLSSCAMPKESDTLKCPFENRTVEARAAAFGMTEQIAKDKIFTGKQYIGYVFPFRDYLTGKGKWNDLTDCNNNLLSFRDFPDSVKWDISNSLSDNSVVSDPIGPYAIYDGNNVDVLKELQNISVILSITVSGTFISINVSGKTSLLDSAVQNAHIILDDKRGTASLSQKTFVFTKRGGPVLASLAYNGIILKLSLTPTKETENERVYTLSYSLSDTGLWSWRQDVDKKDNIGVDKPMTWERRNGNLGTFTFIKTGK